MTTIISSGRAACHACDFSPLNVSRCFAATVTGEAGGAGDGDDLASSPRVTDEARRDAGVLLALADLARVSASACANGCLLVRGDGAEWGRSQEGGSGRGTSMGTSMSITRTRARATRYATRRSQSENGYQIR